MPPVKIGPIQLASPFCQAGLAGYSDRAMRLVARRRGCGYAVTEALLDVIMINGGQGLKKSIDINDEDHPVAGQIMGSEPDTMARAAVILEQYKYDVIDLNYACPVKKIRNKARGGHMLRDLDRALPIMRAVRDALQSDTPISMSLRRSFDDTPESQDALYTILDEAWRLGFVAARVHGRTVEQKYAGRADWTALRQLKKHYPNRTIIGSGDVFTAEDAVRMKLETGVDIVWIARGAIGNPWIFRDADKLLGGHKESGAGSQKPGESSISSGSWLLTPDSSSLSPPTLSEQRDALVEHFAIAMQIHGEQMAGRRMRKMGIKYARFHPQSAEVKHDFINVVSLPDWQRVIDRWYDSPGPGVWPAKDAADEVNDDQSCTSPRI